MGETVIKSRVSFCSSWWCGNPRRLGFFSHSFSQICTVTGGIVRPSGNGQSQEETWAKTKVEGRIIKSERVRASERARHPLCQNQIGAVCCHTNATVSWHHNSKWCLAGAPCYWLTLTYAHASHRRQRSAKTTVSDWKSTFSLSISDTETVDLGSGLLHIIFTRWFACLHNTAALLLHLFICHRTVPSLPPVIPSHSSFPTFFLILSL